ncbi:MAG TPA: pitrilysin family protein, partial [Methylomirabilota bacterium]|nr:pitrilysin family protein [Methylomirabilota bacterium]
MRGMAFAPRAAATLVLAALLASGCATASVRAAAPSGEPPPPVLQVLPNGLTLIVQDHRAADIVAVYLWVATGVRYERPDGLGYAHFQEHMLFKGTDKFGPGYIDRVVEGQGGRDNAFTSFDYTTFQITVPSEATRTAIELLDDMAFRSTFDPKEITAEREVIFEEARIEQDNPKTAIIRQLYGLVFADHPYGRPVLGTTETMNAATQEKLKAFNRQYYTPENMALVVVGPVEAKTVRAMVDGTFGRERRSGYAPPTAPPLRPLTGSVRRTVERPEQQAHLALGWQAPSLSNPDSFPLDLLSTILAGSESSRMAKTLRDGERIVASISMTNSSLQLSGIIYVQADLEAADVE